MKKLFVKMGTKLVSEKCKEGSRQRMSFLGIPAKDAGSCKKDEERKEIK